MRQMNRDSGIPTFDGTLFGANLTNQRIAFVANCPEFGPGIQFGPP